MYGCLIKTKVVSKDHHSIARVKENEYSEISANLNRHALV